MSSVPTAKLEPTKTNEADPAQASKPAKQAPALLEEDDEFEDFPVEGEPPTSPALNRDTNNHGESTRTLTAVQIGVKRMQLSRVERRTCGKRVGMTTMRTMTSAKRYGMLIVGPAWWIKRIDDADDGTNTLHREELKKSGSGK